MERFSLKQLTSTLLVDFSSRGIHRSRSSYGWVGNDRDFRNPGDIRSAWEWVCTGVNLVGWTPSTAFAIVGTSMIMVTRSSCRVRWVWGKVIHIVLAANSSSLVFNWNLTSGAVVYGRTTFLYAVTVFIVITGWSQLKSVIIEAWWWTSSGFVVVWKNWIQKCYW